MAIDRVENTTSAPAVGVGEGDPGGVEDDGMVVPEDGGMVVPEDDGMVVPEDGGMVVPEDDGLVATPAAPARPVQSPDSISTFIISIPSDESGINASATKVCLS